MWTAFCGVCSFGLMLWAVVALAKTSGKKAAQLDALKAEIEQAAKEQERANEIRNRVNNMSVSDVRRRLQDAKSK